MFGRVGLPSLLSFLALNFAAAACVALFIELMPHPELPFWKELLALLYSYFSMWVIIFFVMRPLFGSPTVFRTRDTDRYGARVTGRDLSWTRLRERYTTTEIVVILVAIVALFAGFVPFIQMLER